MKILKNIGLVIATFLLSHFTARFFGELYYFIFSSNYGFFGWSGRSFLYLIGFPLAYLFFLSLIFIAFGDEHKYCWIGIAMIPALAVLVYFDISHIYFHALFVIVGWGLGKGIKLLLRGIN